MHVCPLVSSCVFVKVFFLHYDFFSSMRFFTSVEVFPLKPVRVSKLNSNESSYTNYLFFQFFTQYMFFCQTSFHIVQVVVVHVLVQVVNHVCTTVLEPIISV